MTGRETVSIESSILVLRGHRVILAADLAKIYGVEPRALNQAVKRNQERFPEDFMFQITKEEFNSLRSHFVTLKRGQHRKYLPYVFTEQGVAMLSSVLNSERAIQVNIQIMRAFIKLKEMLATHKDLKSCIGRDLSLRVSDPLPREELEAAKKAWTQDSFVYDGRSCTTTFPRKTFVSEFVASDTGEFFLFVNDAVHIAWPARDQISYRNNTGAATVAIERLPRTEAPATTASAP